MRPADTSTREAAILGFTIVAADYSGCPAFFAVCALHTREINKNENPTPIKKNTRKKSLMPLKLRRSRLFFTSLAPPCHLKQQNVKKMPNNTARNLSVKSSERGALAAQHEFAMPKTNPKLAIADSTNESFNISNNVSCFFILLANVTFKGAG
jgi:hypothetical protein